MNMATSAFKTFKQQMGRQCSIDSNRDDKQGRPAPLLRTSTNHATFFDDPSTPQSTTALKRTLSIIANNFGYQQGSTHHDGLKPMSSIVCPQNIDLSNTLFVNNATPRRQTTLKSPLLLDYQHSFNQNNKLINNTSQGTPLGHSAQKDFNIPQPRFTNRNSVQQQEACYTPSGFFRATSLLTPNKQMNNGQIVPESPELGMKGFRTPLPQQQPVENSQIREPWMRHMATPHE
jgi:hypothetical protein